VDEFMGRTMTKMLMGAT